MAMQPYINLLLPESLNRWDDRDFFEKRLPNLTEVLGSSKTHWQTVTVNHWYGEEKREVEIASETAVWYHTGMPVVPIRWVERA